MARMWDTAERVAACTSLHPGHARMRTNSLKDTIVNQEAGYALVPVASGIFGACGRAKRRLTDRVFVPGAWRAFGTMPLLSLRHAGVAEEAR